MKRIQFKLSNKFGQKIELSLEPEGSIIELPEGKSVLIEVLSKDNPVIDLQINKENNNLYLSIWPEKGKYEIIEESP